MKLLKIRSQENLKNFLSSVIFSFLFSVLSFAQEKTPPPILHHWTNNEKLAQLVPGPLSTKSIAPLINLRRITPSSLFLKNFREFADRKAMFAWPHPVTGMMANAEKEYYGWGESGPALLKMSIDPSAKVSQLKSLYLNPYKDKESGRLESEEAIQEAKKADLIFHQHFFQNRLMFQEWILFNPEVITDYTAHPEVLAAPLEAEIAKIEGSSTYCYPDQETHFVGNKIFSSNEKLRADVVPRLKEYLRTTVTNIPKVFLRLRKF